MTYTDFPANFYVQTFDTSEVVKLGRFYPAEAMELYHIVLHCFKKGTAGGSETLTLKVYGNSSYEGTALATSSAFTLSSASWTSNSNGIGWLRFDFAKQNLNPNNWYYLALTTANYTRNADTYYLGAVLDWPHAVHTAKHNQGAAAKFNIIGYRELD